MFPQLNKDFIWRDKNIIDVVFMFPQLNKDFIWRDKNIIDVVFMFPQLNKDFIWRDKNIIDAFLLLHQFCLGKICIFKMDFIEIQCSVFTTVRLKLYKGCLLLPQNG